MAERQTAQEQRSTFDAIAWGAFFLAGRRRVISAAAFFVR